MALIRQSLNQPLLGPRDRAPSINGDEPYPYTVVTVAPKKTKKTKKPKKLSDSEIQAFLPFRTIPTQLMHIILDYSETLTALWVAKAITVDWRSYMSNYFGPQNIDRFYLAINPNEFLQTLNSNIDSTARNEAIRLSLQGNLCGLFSLAVPVGAVWGMVYWINDVMSFYTDKIQMNQDRGDVFVRKIETSCNEIFYFPNNDTSAICTILPDIANCSSSVMSCIAFNSIVMQCNGIWRTDVFSLDYREQLDGLLNNRSLFPCSTPLFSRLDNCVQANLHNYINEYLGTCETAKISTNYLHFYSIPVLLVGALLSFFGFAILVVNKKIGCNREAGRNRILYKQFSDWLDSMTDTEHYQNIFSSLYSSYSNITVGDFLRKIQSLSPITRESTAEEVKKYEEECAAQEANATLTIQPLAGEKQITVASAPTDNLNSVNEEKSSKIKTPRVYADFFRPPPKTAPQSADVKLELPAPVANQSRSCVLL